MSDITAVTGCFDVPHVGHVQLLNWAATLGFPVVMGVNSDWAISALKGEGRPIYNEVDRMTIWSAFRAVDDVIIVDSTDMVDFLSDVRPKIWVKGSDWTLATMNQQEVKAAQSVGCDIRFFPRIGGASTTDTISKLKG